MNFAQKIDQHHILSYFPNIAFNVVALVASAGGIQALKTILLGLPSNFPAAIVVVQHLNPNVPSHLVQILSQHTALQVKSAVSGDILRPGTVYVAVPGHHLIVQPNGTLQLSDAPKMNFVRPAADKLLMSMATTYKSRAITVVLSGSNCDGALGVLCIKKYGGIAIAQNEATSQFFRMPKAAISTGKVDWVLPLDEIAWKLVNLMASEAVA